MLVVWLVLAGGGSTNGHIQVINFAFKIIYLFDCKYIQTSVKNLEVGGSSNVCLPGERGGGAPRLSGKIVRGPVCYCIFKYKFVLI
jgi:hypothetical protein